MFPLSVRFQIASEEYPQDAYTVTFYGDAADPANQFAMDAATAEHPLQACLHDVKAIGISFSFANHRQYSHVVSLDDQLHALFVKEGWQRVAIPEEFPDAGGSIDDLTYASEFTEEPVVYGDYDFNAARGFTLVLSQEKPVGFSEGEQDEILAMVTEFSLKVFGRHLPEFGRY